MLRLTSRTQRTVATASVMIGVVATGATLVSTTAPRLHAAPSMSTMNREPNDKWLETLKGKHRQFFDTPSPNSGVPLVHLMNYYDTYNKSYGVKDTDISAVLTFYGGTTFYALNDAMWAKYQLGEFLDAINPRTKAPATVNPWRSAPTILGLSLPQASIESLQHRGTTMILCNNALQIFASLLAAKRGLDAGAVYADLTSNILPGIYLVPGMVIAVEQATKAGLSYHRQ